VIDQTDLTFDGAGLIPAVVQDERTGQVLMLGYMNAESLDATQRTGRVTFWSRSRDELWEKGATSGNTLRLVAIDVDCDGDALLVRADPTGPTCHTGASSCFDDSTRQGFAALEGLWDVITSRVTQRPEGSYTAALLAEGPEGPGRKLVEEATEVLLAMKDHANGIGAEDRIAEEAADLVYHLLVALAERGVRATAVVDVLRSRANAARPG
jgi:phosphoribosyl-ATP pyrophosphohydrolase/phosphoribosyl-AMP cyclohydrolase